MWFSCIIDEVTSQQEAIFCDVIDDFSDIFSVAIRFREWKYNFTRSYKQAYISLCVPKLLGPYISLQLISWNPVNISGCVSLENMPWLQDLLFFDCHDESLDPLDPDLLLIPRIIELTVIPKLTSKCIN